MNETRALEQAASRPGRPKSDPAWAEAALRSATFPVGLPAAEEHDWFRGQARQAPEAEVPSDGDFALYPPNPTREPARIERVSDAVDPITARIRNVDSQLRIILDTTFRDRAATVDRSGSPANFGTRLHKALKDAVEAARISGVKAEVSHINGEEVDYGDPSSVRTDILLEIDGRVVAV